MENSDRVVVSQSSTPTKIPIRRLCAFLAVFYAVVSLSTIAIDIFQGYRLAATYKASTRNDLLSGDYRQSMVVLKNGVDAQFDKIQYLDRSGNEVFSLVSEAANTRHIRIREPITLDGARVGSQLVFHLDPLKSIFRITVWWLIFVGIFCVAIKLLAKRIERFYRAEFEKERLLELGEVAHQVAHDIRSPLSALRVLSSVNAWSSDQQKKLFEQTISRMEKIANDILKFKFKDVRSGIFNPTEVLCQFVSEKKAELCLNDSLGLDVKIDLPEVIIARGEAESIHRILSNLINNSVEACGGRGKIGLEAQLSGKCVRIVIADNGSGIPEEVKKNLFVRGFTSKSGNGLGLHSAKRELSKWGGTIDIYSVWGEGTTVKLLIPVVS